MGEKILIKLENNYNILHISRDYKKENNTIISKEIIYSDKFINQCFNIRIFIPFKLNHFAKQNVMEVIK